MNNPSVLVLIALIGTGVGVVVNTLTVLVMGIRGGHAFGELRSTVRAMDGSVALLTNEIRAFREWRIGLGNIDQRVTGLEVEHHELDARLREVEQVTEVLKSDYDVRRVK